jgi:hypothetical protein
VLRTPAHHILYLITLIIFREAHYAVLSTPPHHFLPLRSRISQDCLISTVISLLADDRGSIPGRNMDFSLHRLAHTGSGAIPACLMGIRVPFLGDKAVGM